MDQLLIDKFRLDELHIMPGPECLEALQFLNYLLVRTSDETEKEEIKAYIDQANRRCKELKLIS